MQKQKKQRSKKQGPKPSGAIERLGRQYQADFARKDSGHRPEVVCRMICTIHSQVTATTGSSVYTAQNSNGVINSADFAAIQAGNIYREFRVVALRARFQRLFQLTGPTADFFGAMVGCVGSGNNSPPNATSGMLESQGFRIAREPQGYLELECDAGLNPNARLWSTVQTVAQIPPDNWLWLGMRFTMNAPTGYAGKVVVDGFYEYDVEFRTS